MRKVLLLLAAVATFRCASPAPPAPEPVPAPVTAPAAVEEKAIGTVHVSASALNVRREASTDAEVIVQLKRGDAVTLLASGDSWSKVRLANGETGWAASRFLQSDSGKSASVPATRKKSRNGCPADSDFAFITTPTPTFSDSGAHGLVIIDATVSANGNVTAARVVSNATGDESLAFLAQREIKSAKFSPPIRNCVAKSFIFTYRRTF